MTDTSTTRPGIDPRGPRFSAGIVAVLLLIVIGVALAGQTVAATILFATLVVLFGWGAVACVRRHPFGALFRTVVRPRLARQKELEDPRPPTFAQAVGFVITLTGLVLGLLGVPLAVVIAASVAFVAAFLNAVFGYCLGCQIHLLLLRAGVVRSESTAVHS